MNDLIVALAEHIAQMAGAPGSMPKGSIRRSCKNSPKPCWISHRLAQQTARSQTRPLLKSTACLAVWGPRHPLTYFEHFMADMVLCSGIMKAFLSDPLYSGWHGLDFMEDAFPVLLQLDTLLGIHVLRCYARGCGSQQHWNWSDPFLLVTSRVAWSWNVPSPIYGSSAFGA